MKIHASKVKVVPCPKCKERVDISGCKPFTQIPCTKCGDSLTVPARLGRFLLMRQIGRGAMSRVYHGVDAALGRHVAIKILGQESEGQKELAKRCLEEARALASLNHRNVVQIHSVGQKNSQPFIVMELVKGVRLDRLIKEHGRVDEGRVLEFAIGVAEGLQAAHKVGLVHGDVKPSNILVDMEKVPKLVDFGIAQFQGNNSAQMIYGTPHYVAPEIAQTRKIDMRSDIYSLGATMFHLLTGQYPFEGGSSKEIVQARLLRPAQDVRELQPGITRATAHLVAKMMKTNPQKRFGDYGALIGSLHEAADAVHNPAGSDELDGLADAVDEISQASSGNGARGRRRRIILKLLTSVVVAGVFGALIGALIWYATQHKR